MKSGIEQVRDYVLGTAAGISILVALKLFAPADPGEPVCGAEASPSDLAAVRHLFDRPPLMWEAPYSRTLALEGPAAVQEELAGKFGVTLPERGMQRRLENNLHLLGDFDQNFRVSREYLAQFGLRLRIGQKVDVGQSHIPTDAQLASIDASQTLWSLTEGFASLPYEYVRSTGLRHVVLGAELGKHISAYAEVEGAHDTFVVDVTGGQDEETAPHEVYHLADAAQCGSHGMDNDPAYTDLNGEAGGSIYTGQFYNEDAEAVTLRGDITSSLNSFRRELIEEPDEACRTQRRMEEELSETVAYTDYALKDASEDKAELGAMIAFPERYDEVLDPRTPVIRRKFEFLMARLYHRRPNVVRYLAAVSTRPGGYRYPEATCDDQ